MRQLHIVKQPIRFPLAGCKMKSKICQRAHEAFTKVGPARGLIQSVIAKYYMEVERVLVVLFKADLESSCFHEIKVTCSV